jgi:hypothetical protein
MQLAFQVLLYVVGLPLQLMVIAALLRGPGRQYPFLFLYAIADFLTTVLEIRPSLTIDSATPETLRSFANLYWWDERLLQCLVFLMVISLVYKSSAQYRPRRVLLTGIIVGTVAFAAITFFIHFNPDPAVAPGKWMTPWTRDMNFCAAILDLGLWATLIAAREKDYRLLMVSGALGLQFTGEAISQSLRGMSQQVQDVAAYIVPLPNLACLYIWWQAFRSAPVNSKSGGRPQPETAQSAIPPQNEKWEPRR